jgi:hypothetical protein
MLSTTNDNNESKKLLASGRIFNFLNNSVHEALLLVPARCKNAPCVSGSTGEKDCRLTIVRT